MKPLELWLKSNDFGHLHYRKKTANNACNPNLRTRLKRLVRRTICFSKTTIMHDLVIGLFINRYEFGVTL